MKRRFGLLSAFFFLLVLTASGQKPGIPDIDMAIEKARMDFGVPGLAVAIVKDGKVVLAKGYGYRELGSDELVDENTLFAIASNTKAFTAALLATLVDKGKISWDDRVQEFLPYFELYDPYVSHDVRIRDILSHRVGLRTYSGDLIWYGTPYSREEVIRRARYLKQSYPFRSGYGYSNIMYIAAGEVIEKITGMTWEDYLHQQILDPLNMSHTVLSVSALTDNENVATPHGIKNGKLTKLKWYEWDSTVPAGGIISCASDLSIWLRLVLGRGVWENDTVYTGRQSRIMWTPHTNFVVSRSSREEDPGTNFSGYGLGWRLQDYDGHLVASHGGGYDGMYSQTRLVPDIGLGIVVLTNSMTGITGAITQTVVDAYLERAGRDYFAEALARQSRAAEQERVRAETDDNLHVQDTSPSFALSAYEGTYGGPMYGDATVTLENGQLVLRLLPNPDMVGDLTHWHYDIFAVHWRFDFAWFGDGKVRFIMDDQGKISELQLNVPNHDFWFDELEFLKKK